MGIVTNTKRFDRKRIDNPKSVVLRLICPKVRLSGSSLMRKLYLQSLVISFSLILAESKRNKHNAIKKATFDLVKQQ